MEEGQVCKLWGRKCSDFLVVCAVLLFILALGVWAYGNQECGAFMYEISHISSGGERERKTRRFWWRQNIMALSKYKCLFIILKFSSILHWWQKALAVRPLADLGQAQDREKLNGLPAVRKQSVSFPKSSCSLVSRLFLFPEGSCLAA